MRCESELLLKLGPPNIEFTVLYSQKTTILHLMLTYLNAIFNAAPQAGAYMSNMATLHNITNPKIATKQASEIDIEPSLGIQLLQNLAWSSNSFKTEPNPRLEYDKQHQNPFLRVQLHQNNSEPLP